MRELGPRVTVQSREFACNRQFFDLWEPRVGLVERIQTIDASTIRGLVSKRNAIILGSFLGSLTLLSCGLLLLLRPVAPRPAVVAAAPTPYPSPAAAKPVVTITPTVGPSRFKIGNTDGLGVNLRIEPTLQSRGIRAWPDGTTVEVAGPERVIDGKVWRNLRDPAGNVGWILAEYLLPAE